MAQLPVFKKLAWWIISFISILIALPSQADDLSDLLKQTDAALTRPEKKVAPADSGQNTNLNKAKSSRKSTPSKNSGSTPNAATNRASKSEQTAKPVLGPADAASVNALIKLGASREALLKPSERLHTLGLALGSANLQGSFEVSKDDDHFKAQEGSRIAALLVAYSFDLFEESATSKNGLKFGTLGGQDLRLIPQMGLSTGYLSGKVVTERTGIQNGDYDVAYTIVPVGGHFGVRTSSMWGWRLAMAYGMGIDMFLQTGEGHSDSTSGFFTTDNLSLTADYKLTRDFALGLIWKATGITSVGDNKTKRKVLALSINALLAG